MSALFALHFLICKMGPMGCQGLCVVGTVERSTHPVHTWHTLGPQHTAGAVGRVALCQGHGQHRTSSPFEGQGPSELSLGSAAGEAWSRVAGSPLALAGTGLLSDMASAPGGPMRWALRSPRSNPEGLRTPQLVHPHSGGGDQALLLLLLKEWAPSSPQATGTLQNQDPYPLPSTSRVLGGPVVQRPQF